MRRLLIVLVLALVAGLVSSGAAAADGQGGDIQGTVVDDFGATVPEVTVTVTSAKGGFSEEATSDDNGSFTVAVPQPGSYAVEVDTESLPEGIIVPGDAEAITADVSAGDTASVTVPLSRQEAVGGTLLFEQEPVVGATIRVESADGDFAEETQSEDEGRWQVLLPGPGTYDVALIEDSLPEGVFVTAGMQTTLGGVEVQSGQVKPIIFRLGEETRDISSDWDLAAQLTVEGLRFGLLLALAAIGLSLVYGTTGLVNFAHAELVTLGAIVAWYLNNAGVQLVVAAGLAMLICGALGGVQDTVLWRQLRRRQTGLIAMMIVSIGLSILLRYSFQYVFGAETRSYTDYAVQEGIGFGPIEIAPRDLIAMGVAVVMLLAVAYWLLRTRLGKATRAVSDNPALAAASGIDVQRVILVVWIIGGGLAGLGGILLGISQQVRFDMGFQLLLLIFAAVTLGGLGTAYGALVGSLVVGIFVTVSTVWIPSELKNVAALGILILILLVRPQGILGRAERVG